MKLCSHFGTCGGCTLQDVPPTDYIVAKRNAVAAALSRAGLTNVVIEDAVIVPPHSRRRAIFKIAKSSGVLEIGFHATRSHVIVDMSECLVLSSDLIALVQKLRDRLAALFQNGEKADLHVTICDNGFDCVLTWARKSSPALVTQMARAARGLGITRLILGTEILLEVDAPVVSFDSVAVKLPPRAFLQPTCEGEATLRAHVLAIIGKAKTVADLFAGCGTFALSLATRARVHAVEQDKAMLDALAAAARDTSKLKPVTTEARDLFKRPLAPLELNQFDAVVLDPPRTGAEAQVRALAASKLQRVAYVSCDATSFARDAAMLVDAGFTLGAVTPVDQFLWSSHIELVAGFSRGLKT